MMKRHLDAARDRPKRLRRGSVDRPRTEPFGNLENRNEGFCLAPSVWSVYCPPAMKFPISILSLFHAADFCVRSQGVGSLSPTESKAMPGTASVHGG